MRPFLLLDADGVVNPRFSESSWRKRRSQPSWREKTITVTLDGKEAAIRLRLNREHGPRLLQLAEETGAELIWATTWEGLANEHIGPEIGLPELPWIPFGSRLSEMKASRVLKWARGHGRPFVWLDDDLANMYACQKDPLAVGIWVHGRSGLQDHDFRRAREALARLSCHGREGT